MEAVAGAGQRREALAAAREALTGLGSVLWQVGGAELGPVLTEIDDLIRLGEAARVAVVAEALERDEACSYTGPTPDPATDSDESEQGSADTGALLAPETVRRIGCEAGVLPAVMGGPGQVLDLGHATRWFTPGQTKALWLRDLHCTILGCGMPAQWCDGHHMRHYAVGGPTDMGNATLLCGYHHRWVHDHRLTATIRPEGEVVWDLTPGSYDRRRR